MKTAGLVIDFYDDLTGEILKSVCPTPEKLPEAVKTAHFLTPEERDVLRPEAFALILHNDGDQLRKFACVDPGNTVLSTVYFMETHTNLPPEAVKVAAQNLISFNEEFDLPIPDMLKLAAATGMARRRDSFKQPMVGDEADWAQRTNLLSVRGGADSGRVIPTANQMKIASKKKTSAGIIPAALGGALIYDALTDKINNGGWRAVKGAAGAAMAARGISSAIRTGKHISDEGARRVREFNESRRRRHYSQKEKTSSGANTLTSEFNVDRASEWPNNKPYKMKRKIANVVDVSALEPDPVIINKKAKIAALGSQYALDSYTDVKDAIQFFSDNWTLLDPASRHEFSVKTASRAEELGLQVPELMSRYGSTEYGPDVEAHLASRRAIAPQFKGVWDDLQEKRAMIEPEQFAELLKEADELCNLQYEYGGAVFDPYYSTFGGQGQEKLAWSWESAEGDRLTEDSLRTVPSEELSKTFSKDFVDAFSHDPVTIFESMPDSHKVLISRMVKAS